MSKLCGLLHGHVKLATRTNADRGLPSMRAVRGQISSSAHRGRCTRLRGRAADLAGGCLARRLCTPGGRMATDYFAQVWATDAARRLGDQFEGPPTHARP